MAKEASGNECLRMRRITY